MLLLLKMMIIMIIDHFYSATLSTTTQRRPRLQPDTVSYSFTPKRTGNLIERLAQSPCIRGG